MAPTCLTYHLYAAKRADEKLTQHGFALTDVWLWADRTQVSHVCLYYMWVGGGTERDSHSSVTQLREDNKGAVALVLSGIHIAIIFAAYKLN